MGNAAFEDLNIDPNLMMLDPVKFAEQVYEAADSLREVMRADTSTAAITRQFEEIKAPADSSISVLMNAIYEMADELPLEQMPNIIEQARTLVRDLETQFKDRVFLEASKNSKEVKDKKLAALMYKDLRDAFNDIVEFITTFFKNKLPKDYVMKPLPSMPGNWGANTTGLKHYTFQIGDDADNIYRQPAAVCRKLGVPLIHMYDDFFEFIEANPQHDIRVKEIL